MYNTFTNDDIQILKQMIEELRAKQAMDKYTAFQKELYLKELLLKENKKKEVNNLFNKLTGIFKRRK